MYEGINNYFEIFFYIHNLFRMWKEASCILQTKIISPVVKMFGKGSRRTCILLWQSLLNDNHIYRETLLVREGLECASPIETTYYADK